MRVSKKIHTTCPTCDKEFSYIPSKKKTYCSHSCFLNFPENKSKRRKVLSRYYEKEA